MKSTPIIAIADDDESVRSALDSLLRSTGYRALVYSDAESFLADDRHLQVDCLIADVHMPGCNGLELLEALRTEGLDYPVIIITAFSDAQLRLRAARLGAAALLCKPFCGGDVAALLDQVLNQRSHLV